MRKLKLREVDHLPKDMKLAELGLKSRSLGTNYYS